MTFFKNSEIFVVIFNEIVAPRGEGSDKKLPWKQLSIQELLVVTFPLALISSPIFAASLHLYNPRGSYFIYSVVNPNYQFWPVLLLLTLT
ncbi:unnamed protein product, partial [Allacma fusca]